jgi:DNA-binding NtrC family response regulator
LTPVKSILYLGCPPADRTDAAERLAAAGLAVVWADRLEEALNDLKRKDMSVLVDLTIGSAALQAMRDVRAQSAAIPVFAVAATKRADLTTEAILAGVADVFARPLIGSDVARTLDWETQSSTRETNHPRPERLYAHSPLMREAVAAAAKAANADGGLLVRGEDGSGRRIVAYAIHTVQRGTPAGFAVVNCAEGAAVERLLFGVAARTTRATRSSAAARDLEHVSRKSVIHETRSGTLYLRNVADAPARLQARLSRVLRDGEALVAETAQRVEITTRPIAAADDGFDAAVHDGLVRRDLAKRLSAGAIHVPPLRDRRDDVAPLANAFLREICRSRGVPPRTLSRSALALMSALPWRGNVPELRALLERIVSSAQGGRHVGLEDVLAHVRLDAGSIAAPRGGTLKAARATFEREYIQAALSRCEGRIAEAARLLGIQRTNLYRKMRTLRIKKEGLE